MNPSNPRPSLQVSGNAATVRFRFATKPMSAAAAKGGFLSCLLPHHVDAGASGKVALQVNPASELAYSCHMRASLSYDAVRMSKSWVQDLTSASVAVSCIARLAGSTPPITIHRCNACPSITVLRAEHADSRSARLFCHRPSHTRAAGRLPDAQRPDDVRGGDSGRKRGALLAGERGRHGFHP